MAYPGPFVYARPAREADGGTARENADTSRKRSALV